ncbi:GNAT family N-acetyltransferase [Tetragenococcus solitarius]|uniref:GNAT family N-acetyltransferase n=1 Tax=Tetragenococcus solitarius TaxID=71453 RepID=A0ABN3YAB8_9ENTE|nr:GNAT family N-acetyltransferase [Tetragenococcus solitarius]
MQYKIREMNKNDWPFVYDIYHQGMATNLATFTVEQLTYEEFDQQRLQEGRFVLLDDNRVIGWATLKQAYEIPEYYGVAEVSIYIDSYYQGKGAGSTLLNYLVDYSEKIGFWTLEADIFANNYGSQRLHEKCGFRKVGYREKLGKDQYGVWRDSVLMERRSKKVGID